MYLTDFKNFIINDFKILKEYFKTTPFIDLPLVMSIMIPLIPYIILLKQSTDSTIDETNFIILVVILCTIYFVGMTVGIYLKRINPSAISLGSRTRIAIITTYLTILLLDSYTLITNIIWTGIYASILYIPCILTLSLIIYITALICSIMSRNLSRLKEIMLNDLKTIKNLKENFKSYVKDPAFYMGFLLPLILSFNYISDKQKMEEMQYILLSIDLLIVYIGVIYLGVYFNKISPLHLTLTKRFKIAFWFSYFFLEFSDTQNVYEFLLSLLREPTQILNLLCAMVMHLFLILPYLILFFVIISAYIYTSILVFSVLFNKPIKLPKNLLIIAIIIVQLFALYYAYSLIAHYSNPHLSYPFGYIR